MFELFSTVHEKKKIKKCKYSSNFKLILVPVVFYIGIYQKLIPLENIICYT